MKTHTVTDPTTGKVTRVKSRMSQRCNCGKLAYTSRKHAKSNAAVQAKASGEPIEAYRCRRGGHCWHIGHRLDWKHEQAQAS